jgi:ADP-heptose:LPS heptosyltransferase
MNKADLLRIVRRLDRVLGYPIICVLRGFFIILRMRIGALLARQKDDGTAHISDVVIDEGLVPELHYDPVDRQSAEAFETFTLLQVGWMKRQNGGYRTGSLLRPIDFLRAQITSRAPLGELVVRVNGRVVGRSKGGMPISVGRLQRVYFTCWLDLRSFGPGRYRLQVQFERPGMLALWHERKVELVSAPSEAEQAFSCAAVSADVLAVGVSIEAQLNKLPSTAFSAARRTISGPFNNILIVRADQLGDLVASTPAILALRDLFPEARLHGLFSSSGCELAASFGIFETVTTLDMPYDSFGRRRYLSYEDQRKLKAQLGAYRYDLAIDLSTASHTRWLLKLSGARQTVGFHSEDFPWLSFGLNSRTYDAINGKERAAHSCKPSNLVAALAEEVRRSPVVVRQAGLNRQLLVSVGLDPECKFALLHTGARTPSRLWPIDHYVILARRLVYDLGLYVVLILDHPEQLSGIDISKLDCDRLTVISSRLDFTHFDTLISFCEVFIGNDSGPKHLAALRGVPVVGIHTAIVNWTEWGQEGTGLIVTRQVPCAGCGIEAIEECGLGVPCLMRIQPDEVFEAVRRLVKVA